MSGEMDNAALIRLGMATASAINNADAWADRCTFGDYGDYGNGAEAGALEMLRLIADEAHRPARGHPMSLVEKALADELVELRRHMADRPNMTIDAATHEAALARHLACEQAWRQTVAETADYVRGLS